MSAAANDGTPCEVQPFPHARLQAPKEVRVPPDYIYNTLARFSLVACMITVNPNIETTFEFKPRGVRVLRPKGLLGVAQRAESRYFGAWTHTHGAGYQLIPRLEQSPNLEPSDFAWMMTVPNNIHRELRRPVLKAIDIPPFLLFELPFGEALGVVTLVRNGPTVPLPQLGASISRCRGKRLLEWASRFPVHTTTLTVARVRNFAYGCATTPQRRFWWLDGPA
ncbi:hypothetical protein DFH06DRAFT_1295938 [Mycena polygramma]|nr:hypothetical protein DFH06DRAFT_1295938 [Mycena polygramma]